MAAEVYILLFEYICSGWCGQGRREWVVEKHLVVEKTSGQFSFAFLLSWPPIPAGGLPQLKDDGLG